MPISLARRTVCPSATAPAASVGPSVPSVPPARRTTRSRPSRAIALASTNSWLRPPRHRLEGHRGFAADQDTGRRFNGLPGTQDFLADGAEGLGYFACLALHLRRQDQTLVAKRSAVRAAAVRARRQDPTNTCAQRSNTGSPGLGVSARAPLTPRITRWRTESGIWFQIS